MRPKEKVRDLIFSVLRRSQGTDKTQDPGPIYATALPPCQGVPAGLGSVPSTSTFHVGSGPN